MMRNHCHYAAVLTFSLVLLLYMVAPARAAEVQPGDACTVAGQVMETGGPEQIPGRVLVCNGATWKTVREQATDGKVLFQVNSDPGACNSDKQGRLRYTSASDVWEYCTGSAWSPFKKPLCQEDDTGECFLKLPRSVNDTDFMAANIASGVNILGIVGTHASVPTIAVNKISTAVLTKCFITSTGRAYCWGDYTCYFASNGSCTNAWGVNISTINTSGSNGWTHLAAPIEVYGGHTDWTAIAVNATHSCGIRASQIYCWGENVSGALGTGNNTDQIIPTLVSGGFSDWTKLATGGVNYYGAGYYTQGHTCGIRSNGRLYCWGENSDGQLGRGNTTDANAPVEVSGAATDWAQVSGGSWHTCALKTTGRLYCWGYGGNGALGRGNYTTINTPGEVSGAATDWAQISTGAQHSCAVKTTGRLYCWGWNGNGELGTGNTTQSNTPQQVSGATTDWSVVAAGFRMTCAIKTSGRLYCWGFGGGGERGDGTLTNSQTTPVEVSGAYTDWIAVSAGGASDDYPTSSTATDTWGSVCGIRSNGRLYCWGDGDIGSLGDGVSREWDLNNNQTTPWPVLLNIQ